MTRRASYDAASIVCRGELPMTRRALSTRPSYLVESVMKRNAGMKDSGGACQIVSCSPR